MLFHWPILDLIGAVSRALEPLVWASVVGVVLVLVLATLHERRRQDS